MTKLTDLKAKYERKLKKEYQRGYDDGVEAEAKVKKGTKRYCSLCGKIISSRAGNNKGE